MQSNPNKEPMSVSFHYSGLCCAYCCNPARWGSRPNTHGNAKAVTLRTHRTGKGGKHGKALKSRLRT